MATHPKGFSFCGIGEPIRQVRERIKDFWYRNSHEKKLAELERLRQLLDLLSEQRVPPMEAVVLVAHLNVSDKITEVERIVEAIEHQTAKPVPEASSELVAEAGNLPKQSFPK